MSLSIKQLAWITQKQKEMIAAFEDVPKKGKFIRFQGKEFIVFRGVFWPFDGTIPLVEKYTVNHGELFLDVCTGSGVIAIDSAYKGAKKIVALDINPEAIRAAKINVERHGFTGKIETRVSDMFAALKLGEQFDVITGNLPFRDKLSKNLVEGTMWDINFRTHKNFFAGLKNYLRPGGRAYISQANFGEIKKMHQFAQEFGFVACLIGERKMQGEDPRVFYAFEIMPK